MTQVSPTVPPAAASEHRSGPSADATFYSYHNSRQTVKSDPRSRVGVVLDTQNLVGWALRLGFREVDYGMVLREIVVGRPWCGVACVARPLSRTPIDAFTRYLSRVGLRVEVWESPVCAGRLKVDLDALLIREAMRLIYTMDLAELCVVANDADYHVLADTCASHGIRFSVAGFRRGLPDALVSHADRIVGLGPEHLTRGATRRRWS